MRSLPVSRLFLIPAFPLLLAYLAACGEAAPSGPEVVRETLGDTTVVHTLSGSVWGAPAHLVPEVSIGELEGDLPYLFGQPASLAVADDGAILVVDRQVPELRVFDPDGTYRVTMGRPGEGPGELKSPDGGLVVLSDGRVLVRDPGNARIQVFGPEGTALATWPIRGGFQTSTPMFHDRQDHVYIQVLVDPEADVRDWRMGLVRMNSEGQPGDTLLVPDAGYDAPSLEARRDGGVSRTGVPYSPSEEWTVHPGGFFVHGVSTEYAVDLLRPGAPLRIRRTRQAVPVTAGERGSAELRAIRNMRSTVPDWRWNGPSIPREKPPFRDLATGRDGRIWVQVTMPGQEVENPDFDPRDESSSPTRWVEPVVFDVFEEDGTYLGEVWAPEGFRSYPVPVFGTDHVWATTQDEMGVIRVVRFRIEAGTGI